MVSNNQLQIYLDHLLDSKAFKDYCPNGMHVEGCKQIQTIALATTASLDAINEAARIQADALIVHHGFYWYKNMPLATGIYGKRLKALFDANINLYAYHLPLDAHQSLGNNFYLGQLLDITNPQALNKESLIWQGLVNWSFQDAQTFLEKKFAKPVISIEAGNHLIKKIAWCSGAAQSMIEELDDTTDAYVSGEISEATTHIAKERGIHYFACGHHATETGGVKLLGKHLEKQFGCRCHYIELDNPA